MRIGLTYDLRDDYLAAGYDEETTAEFDRLSTIDAIDSTLRNLGHQTERIGRLSSLVSALSQNRRWDLVFNIAEGLHGIGRESQVPALLDAYEIPYTFSDPLVSALTLHKGHAKRVIRDSGLPTPDFAVVESVDDLAALRIPFPLFAKPLAEGTGKGVTPDSRVSDSPSLRRVVSRLLARFNQPVLVESFLPGREFTVGLIGTAGGARALGTMEVLLRPQAEAGVYSYANKEKSEETCEYRLIEGPLAQEAERLAVRAWRVLGCRDAGRIDLRADASGRLQFLEANPLAGLHPEHSDLPILCSLAGITFRELIEMILNSAQTRLR